MFNGRSDIDVAVDVLRKSADVIAPPWPVLNTTEMAGTASHAVHQSHGTVAGEVSPGCAGENS